MTRPWGSAPHMSPSSVLLERRTSDYTVSIVRYAPHCALPPHAHEADGISVILDGEVVEECRHRSAIAQAGWTAVRPAGVRHTNRFGPAGATVLAIVVTAADHRVRLWNWTDLPVAFRTGLRLLGSQTGTLSEVETWMNPLGGRREVPHSHWLESISRMLRDLQAPPVRLLGAKLGLHPVYLTRRYRAAYGVSIREHRRIVQVQQAIRLLLGTDRPISEIAYRCGFADHSHMCRAFRSVAGWQPSALRKVAS